jgi:hypothetical protein
MEAARPPGTEPPPAVRVSRARAGLAVPGTKDKDYNLLWFTQACLDNALRLEQYAQDAERDGDDELADLFRRAQADSRKDAEQGNAQNAAWVEHVDHERDGAGTLARARGVAASC